MYPTGYNITFSLPTVSNVQISWLMSAYDADVPVGNIDFFRGRGATICPQRARKNLFAELDRQLLRLM
jgi:hypothetical protein